MTWNTFSYVTNKVDCMNKSGNFYIDGIFNIESMAYFSSYILHS